MTTLNAMFRGGENEIFSAEWEILDTPPAQAWKRMQEHAIENPKDDPLHTVESAFCGSREEAKALWDAVRADPFVRGTPYERAQFKKIKAGNCQDLIERLQRKILNGMLRNSDESYRVRDLVDDLKRVQFYLDHIHDTEFPNEDSGFGQFHVIPDPKFGIEFDRSWDQYLTMDIEPGTIYADLHYAEFSWVNIIEYPDVKSTYEPLKNKRFGPPTLLGSGFFVPFHQDLGGVETDLVQWLFDNHNMIAHLDPTYDPTYALRVAGRMPVAKLKTAIGARGYPGYDHLKKITGLFKLEVYE